MNPGVAGTERDVNLFQTLTQPQLQQRGSRLCSQEGLRGEGRGEDGEGLTQ